MEIVLSAAKYVRATVQEGIILCFLLIVVGGLWSALTGMSWMLPLQTLASWEYGLMSPFVAYTTTNLVLIAEAQLPDTTWERVNLDRYFPEYRGDQLKDQWSLTSRTDATKAFEDLANNILRKEHAMGKQYTALRLSWDSWPTSENGFESQHDSDQTTTALITTVDFSTAP